MSESEHTEKICVLLIDLQKSFVEGSWMSYVGEQEILPIKHAFANAASFLSHLDPQNDRCSIILSRCPFYGDDFDFHDSVSQYTSDKICVIKPGNSIMMARGFPEWLSDRIDEGCGKLIIGGCTTNSCVRVSAIETKKRFSDLEICVDLSLCGCRQSNFVKHCAACFQLYLDMGVHRTCEKCLDPSNENRMSSLDAAIKQMKDVGVSVVDKWDWTPYFS